MKAVKGNSQSLCFDCGEGGEPEMYSGRTRCGKCH